MRHRDRQRNRERGSKAAAHVYLSVRDLPPALPVQREREKQREGERNRGREKQRQGVKLLCV